MEQATRCLVIGGSGTLGREVSRALAAGGARVALTFHHGERLAATLGAELGATLHRLDASDVSAIGETVAAASRSLGGLDALVHCAAVGTGRPEGAEDRLPPTLAEIDEALWDRVLSINTKSAFFAAQAAAPALAEAGGGNIVFVGSIDGDKPVPSPIHYAASKAALGGVTRALCKELGAARICVNTVSPGVLDGGISRHLSDELKGEYKKHCALRRLGRHDEVARFIAWLAQHNTYVTGRVLTVDGGL